ncbi:MAG: hypothetical protein ACW981_15745 [Candidatus Hodarchaeales archaeon]
MNDVSIFMLVAVVVSGTVTVDAGSLTVEAGIVFVSVAVEGGAVTVVV